MRFERMHDSAVIELREAARYYEERDPGVGSEFLREVREAVETILANPECGSLTNEEGVRALRGRRFPYSVVFETGSLPPYIVAIYHERRRPSGWKERLL